MTLQCEEFQILETFASSPAPAMAWKSDNSGRVAISGTKVVPDNILNVFLQQ